MSSVPTCRCPDARHCGECDRCPRCQCRCFRYELHELYGDDEADE